MTPNRCCFQREVGTVDKIALLHLHTEDFTPVNIDIFVHQHTIYEYIYIYIYLTNFHRTFCSERSMYLSAVVTAVVVAQIVATACGNNGRRLIILIGIYPLRFDLSCSRKRGREREYIHNRWKKGEHAEQT